MSANRVLVAHGNAFAAAMRAASGLTDEEHSERRIESYKLDYVHGRISLEELERQLERELAR